ncbi:butyrophilin subfamily 3 member A2-like isoform X2 [Alosa sapidissima]|uniref:butyrophilin subfamily 3 member A2-like isoform X2 n=1 Tax=Alosa sapidissima TaxID=34773 RepID=UPI001C07F491|nr:butyrophilin subfamily 3 member A2-like isoform X2 [Alosa sapidissima]
MKRKFATDNTSHIHAHTILQLLVPFGLLNVEFKIFLTCRWVVCHLAKMKDLYWSLLVLCIISTAAGVEVVGPDGPVVAVVGEDLILPCSLNSSTSAVDDEMTWLIGTKIVHHHKNRQDWTDQQLPAYRGRTSLFTEELQRGNLSLKIRNVTLSDANTYRCYIATDTMPAEATVSVTVETVGSTPVISAEGLGNGSARLQCESSGWSSEPQVEWVDSEGRTLPVDPPCIQRFPEGLRVKSSVTVEQSDGSNFLCRVTSPGQTRETRVEVPRPQFDHTRHYYWIMAPFGLLILILLIIIGCQSRVISGMSQELLSQPSPETSADNMKIKWNNEEARVYLYKNGHVIERSGTVSDLQEGEISVRLRLSRSGQS